MTHENKFGMFIHWGIYSLTELQDQAIVRYEMEKEEYEGLVKKFNPIKYDPEEWVLLAKSAGMKYICITTKHHDGFCMWDTAYTDYKITNTPYGKDVIKMLADACHKHGMLLSFYYSNPDWNHKYGYNPSSSHQWRAVKTDTPNTEAYREYVKNQITELLTNYGKIYTLFWDIPPKICDPSLNELARRLQPEIYINDRGWDKGDFSTPEREYRATEGKRFASMTEACNSLGEQSWGYRREEDFYSMHHIMSSIDRIMAMGGSYLLNVGPSHSGEITSEYADRIRKVGDWYLRTEGCLECHEEDDFDYGVKNNECIVTKKDGKSYFHFPNGLISSAVAIKNYPSEPKTVRLVNNNANLSYKIERLPEFFNGHTGVAYVYLHIREIPIDDLHGEPIIIEIKW